MRRINTFFIAMLIAFSSSFVGCELEEGDDTPTPEGTIGNYTNVKLLFSTLSLDEKNMFNLDDGTTLSATGDVADMDFAYCWDDNEVHSIVSPNSAWMASVWDKRGVTYDVSDKNTTKLEKVDVDFADIDLTELANINISSSSDIHNLDNGDVIAFETSDGKKGFIEIVLKKVTVSIYVNVKYLKEVE